MPMGFSLIFFFTYIIMCDIFRENYKKCFEAFGARQCKLELDELFNCINTNERYIKYSHIVRVR